MKNAGEGSPYFEVWTSDEEARDANFAYLVLRGSAVAEWAVR
jgi:hypothetical protein